MQFSDLQCSEEYNFISFFLSFVGCGNSFSLARMVPTELILLQLIFVRFTTELAIVNASMQINLYVNVPDLSESLIKSYESKNSRISISPGIVLEKKEESSPFLGP